MGDYHKESWLSDSNLRGVADELKSSLMPILMEIDANQKELYRNIKYHFLEEEERICINIKRNWERAVRVMRRYNLDEAELRRMGYNKMMDDLETAISPHRKTFGINFGSKYWKDVSEKRTKHAMAFLRFSDDFMYKLLDRIGALDDNRPYSGLSSVEVPGSPADIGGTNYRTDGLAADIEPKLDVDKTLIDKFVIRMLFLINRDEFYGEEIKGLFMEYFPVISKYDLNSDDYNMLKRLNEDVLALPDKQLIRRDDSSIPRYKMLIKKLAYDINV